MTTKKISELDAASSSAASDIYEIETAGGASKRATAAQLLTYIAANIALAASKITSGALALARGGTNADLSATGGANQIVRQNSAGGTFTVSALAADDIPTLTASKVSDFDTQVQTSTLNQMTAPTADLSINSHKLTSVTDPTSAQDAATKAYVDGVAQGLSPKGACQLATAAALPTNTYLAGVLTGTATGVLTVDGTAVAAGNRILVKNESTQANNGIYSCTTAGAVGVAYVLTRATDMDVASEIPGAFSFVEGGTANVGLGFVVAGAGPYTVGTTAIVWTQFSGAGEITAGTGITKSGNTLSVDTTVIAPLASPTFTGTPAAPTAAGGTNTTQLATTAFVTTAVAAVSVSGAGVSAFSAHKNTTDQTVNAGFTKLTFTTEEFDVGSDYDATNSKYTPVAGKYLLTCTIRVVSPGTETVVAIYKNGSEVKRGADVSRTQQYFSHTVTAIVAANGTDYFEFYVYENASSIAVSGETFLSYAQGYKLA